MTSTRSRWLLALIVLSTIARIVYAAHVDPLQGPDSSTYFEAGRAIRDLGVSSDSLPGVPYFPIGYPVLVAILGHWIVFLQVVLVGATAWVLYLGTRDVIGESSAFVAGVLVTLNPALSSASTFYMYETVLAFLIVASAALLSRWPVAALGCLGVAAVIQPKALIVGICYLAWLATKQRVTLLGFAALALMILPTANLAMNRHLYGQWGLSANLGATMRVGFNDHADGTYSSPGTALACARGDDLFERDRSLTACSIRWALAHSGRLPKIEAMKAAAFWSPYIGPLTQRSTWYSRLDFRSLYPAWVTESVGFKRADLVAGTLWTLALLVALIAGAVLVGRDGVIWWLPIAAFFVVTLGTLGDARFRLPVVPLCIAFQSVALVRCWGWLESKSSLLSRSGHLTPRRSGSMTSNRHV